MISTPTLRAAQTLASGQMQPELATKETVNAPPPSLRERYRCLIEEEVAFARERLEQRRKGANPTHGLTEAEVTQDHCITDVGLRALLRGRSQADQQRILECFEFYKPARPLGAPAKWIRQHAERLSVRYDVVNQAAGYQKQLANLAYLQELFPEEYGTVGLETFEARWREVKGGHPPMWTTAEENRRQREKPAASKRKRRKQT